MQRGKVMMKLIVSDMDGTIVKSNLEIPHEIVPIFRTLIDKGIVCGIATGRSFHSIKHTFKEIYDDMLIISENGAMVYYKGEVLQAATIPKEMAKQVYEISKRSDGVIAFSGVKKGYVFNGNEDVMHIMEHHFPKLECIDSFDDIDVEFLEISIYFKNQTSLNTLALFDELKEEVNAVSSADDWIDINVHGLNKGEAIQHIQQKLGIKKEESMAFGDNMNDLELLQCVEESYAVGNAHEKVKEVAKHVIGTNDDEAVLAELKKLYSL